MYPKEIKTHKIKINTIKTKMYMITMMMI